MMTMHTARLSGPGARGFSRSGRLTTLATLVACLVASPALRGDHSLDLAVLKQAPEIISYLKDHRYKNVGVLKFRVKKGDEPASDHVGPLNLNIAGRLEI